MPKGIPREDINRISVKETATGKCSICGKRMSITKEFEQFANEENRRSDGKTKTRWEIREELWAEAREWLNQPLVHPKGCKREEKR